ncbi:MAG: hypothetical protein ABWZ74_07305 [Hyphomicrobiaceae bacterium]|jgi:hypothetical protein
MTGIHRRASGVVVACAMAASLSACGAVDGVELNGKIFDALGVSTGSLGPRPEPKVERRSPIVLPPDANRLPEPGSAPVAANANQAWPVDRDQKKVVDAAEAKRKQDEHCKDGNWKEKAMQDEVAASQGPSGGCGSIFNAFSKSLFGAQE